MGQLEGKIAVVVGGHSGFGEAIARLFAAEGATVVVAGRRAHAVAELASSVGVGMVCDITDDEQVGALVGRVQATVGPIDIFVNSAGSDLAATLVDLTPERLKVMTDVHFVGAVYCMHHAGAAMAANGGGAFLSISSQAAHSPAKGQLACGSAKAALEHATRVAAVELGPKGVRFNVVAPSLIETPMTAKQFQRLEEIEAVRELTPLGRIGCPSDVAQAALYLCGPMGSFVTGVVLCVDGGASLLGLPTPQVYADVARRRAEGLHT